MRQKIFFIAFISFLLLCNSCIWTEEGYNKSVMSEEYSGVVKDTVENRQSVIYTLNNGKTIGWRQGEFPPYHKYISLRDTCLKPKGSMVLMVLRTNGDTALLDLSWAAKMDFGSFEIHTPKTVKYPDLRLMAIRFNNEFVRRITFHGIILLITQFTNSPIP